MDDRSNCKRRTPMAKNPEILKMPIQTLKQQVLCCAKKLTEGKTYRFILFRALNISTDRFSSNRHTKTSIMRDLMSVKP
jgi:hypothetical protein